MPVCRPFNIQNDINIVSKALELWIFFALSPFLSNC